jgi:hypothetical protein
MGYPGLNIFELQPSYEVMLGSYAKISVEFHFRAAASLYVLAQTQNVSIQQIRN